MAYFYSAWYNTLNMCTHIYLTTQKMTHKTLTKLLSLKYPSDFHTIQPTNGICFFNLIRNFENQIDIDLLKQKVIEFITTSHSF
jgi:hypothetical protein